MQYTDHFREVTKQRLIRLVLGGSLAGVALDCILFLPGIYAVMPFVAPGILIILPAALFDWLDFTTGLLRREE